MVQNSAETGAYFLRQLESMKDEHPIIGDVRGIGLLLGLELVKDRDSKEPLSSDLHVGERLTEKFRERGLILRGTDQMLNLAPPLCATEGDIDQIASGIDGALSELESELAHSA